jgi:hypothetical protein
MSSLGDTSNAEVWQLAAAMNLDQATWPSVLLAILWRLWDARSGTVFRKEAHST